MKRRNRREKREKTNRKIKTVGYNPVYISY